MSTRQTNRQIVSPFQGEPRTSSVFDENGNPAMLVRIAEVTPQGASLADGLSSLCTFILFIFLFSAGAGSGNGLIWIVCMVMPFLFHSSIVEFFYSNMTKNLDVLFTPREFRVKTEWGDWQIYDRTLTHRFVMMKHDKAREERDNHDRTIRRAQIRGQVASPKRYFDESFHIIFDYLGQRFDVVTIYDEKRATAVATRFMAIDKIMDMKNQMGEGEVLTPAEQWKDAPGSLPMDW